MIQLVSITKVFPGWMWMEMTHDGRELAKQSVRSQLHLHVLDHAMVMVSEPKTLMRYDERLGDVHIHVEVTAAPQ